MNQLIDEYITQYLAEGNTAYSKANIAVELIEKLIELKGANERVG